MSREIISGEPSRLHAVAVTYRRPEILERTLRAFDLQTKQYDSLLIVDNDADNAVRALAAARPEWSYLALSENAGPAGGIAAGMSEVLGSADDTDWLLVIDDDDPPLLEDAVERLYNFALAADVDVGLVGLTGPRFSPWTGRQYRLADTDLVDGADVAGIGNGQVPLYRVGALRESGVMDPELFFGAEEIELGLRLRSFGWRAVVCGALTLELRETTGRLGLGSTARSRRRPSRWRDYYAARNNLIVARRFGRWTAPLMVTGRVLAGGAVYSIRTRSTAPLATRMSGLSDGWRGRIGRTVEPPSAR